MTNEQKAAAWDKATELATDLVIKRTSSFEQIRDVIVDAIKWQAEKDKLMLDAKDESIIQIKMTVFERVQSVCRYRCARIGDTYKCAKGDNFGEYCDRKHCKILG